MDNVNQPATGGSKTGMWVALTIALVVIGAGAYLLFARENGTNTNNGNVVSVQNTNSNVSQNGNSVTNSNSNKNTNLDANSDTTANSNTAPSLNSNANSMDTTGWKTYEDSEFGFAFNYPPSWSFSVWQQTGEISFRSGQEPVPLFKAVGGSIDDAIAWLNNRDGVNGVYSKTSKTITVGGTVSTVYSNGEFDNYAITDMNGYALITHDVTYLLDDPDEFYSIAASVTKS